MQASSINPINYIRRKSTILILAIALNVAKIEITVIGIRIIEIIGKV